MMITREKKRVVVSKHMKLIAITEPIQKIAIEILYPLLLEKNIKKSDLIRKCFLNENFNDFKLLSNNILANVF